jgi:hypothetical protein
MSTFKKLQEPLQGSDLILRVGHQVGSWCTLMVYKDARVDMTRLDEVVGAENWQRRHYSEKNTLFCSVGVKINNEWVWKDDAGEPSNVHEQKGESSDSFKRACVNWGIGKELYEEPYKGISLTLKASDLDKKGKLSLFGWQLKNKIENGKVVKIGVFDKSGELRFSKSI